PSVSPWAWSPDPANLPPSSFLDEGVSGVHADGPKIMRWYDAVCREGVGPVVLRRSGGRRLSCRGGLAGRFGPRRRVRATPDSAGQRRHGDTGDRGDRQDQPDQGLASRPAVEADERV